MNKKDLRTRGVYILAYVSFAAAALALLLRPAGAGGVSLALGIATCAGSLALIILLHKTFAAMERERLAFKESAAQEKQNIRRDSLTDVFDRETTVYLIERFLAAEDGEGVHGLIMLDVDGLAEINANKGKEFGDLVLMTVAERMSALFRQTDIVGRLGEDEFVVFLKNVNSRTQLQSQCAALIAELESGTLSAGPRANCSLGGAVCPDDAGDCATLLQKAESALARAKKKGANHYALYDAKKDDVFSVE